MASASGGFARLVFYFHFQFLALILVFAFSISAIVPFKSSFVNGHFS